MLKPEKSGRIAGLKKEECQIAVEDVMYMFIYYKFSEIGVHLVPQISQCVYNGRLEIWPSRDWELESIHSIEAVEMVREHLNDVVGWRANSNVTESWALTEIPRLHLCKLYAASILYGYFLKSASLRHSLERGLDLSSFSNGDSTHVSVPETFSLESKFVAFGHSKPRSAPVGQASHGLVKNPKDLKCYLMGFDQETIQMWAKPQSNEALNLIERYTYALFGDKNSCLLETDERVSTSFASLKRFVLEAVAFGSFLQEAENCVNEVYRREEN